MNYLKYNLKIKYYFSDRIVPTFDFANLFEKLKQNVLETNMYSEQIFEINKS